MKNPLACSPVLASVSVKWKKTHIFRFSADIQDAYKKYCNMAVERIR